MSDIPIVDLDARSRQNNQDVVLFCSPRFVATGRAGFMFKDRIKNYW